MTLYWILLTYSVDLPTWTFCATGSPIIVLIVCVTFLRWRSRPPHVIVETTATNSDTDAALRTRTPDKE